MTLEEKPDGTGSQLVSDMFVAQWLGSIEIDGYPGLTKLDASALKSESPDTDAKAQRFELISAVRGGKHVELSVMAQTFEQTSAHNRRYLRLADEKLSSRAGTWKGQPYLIDHSTWSIESSKGTILSSKAVETGEGATAFHQKLNVVKADAVIGVLDGTFNKFSVGWWPAGPVLCSVHGCDISLRDSCECWPGDKVTLDGKKHTVEFVFTDFKGKETSTVVIPAVQNTGITDIRAALAAELNIPRTRRAGIPHTIKETEMKFHRLAVALGLSALGEDDEDRALAAVSALQALANTAETSAATLRGSLVQAEAAVRTLTAAQLGVQVGAILQADGFSAGKLRRERDANGALTVGPIEGFLRKLATDGGLEVMKAQLAAMPVVVPLGQRQADNAKEPALTVVGDEDILTDDNPYLRNAAELTGQKVGDLVAFAKSHTGGVQ